MSVQSWTPTLRTSSFLDSSNVLSASFMTWKGFRMSWATIRVVSAIAAFRPSSVILSKRGLRICASTRLTRIRWANVAPKSARKMVSHRIGGKRSRNVVGRMAAWSMWAISFSPILMGVLVNAWLLKIVSASAESRLHPLTFWGVFPGIAYSMRIHACTDGYFSLQSERS